MRLTTAQALVRWLLAQRTVLLDGTEAPLFPAVFAIFGHGNVLGLGTALSEHAGELPVWRGHTEQGMALAAVAHARATHRRQTGVVTSSIGPGALNMVTAAGVAHANRLPLLLLPGDTFVNRAPDPVLQQVEPFGDGTATVNDAFRAVSRWFDRITRPEQLLATLPQVARVLTDPADCGPVTLALPQDVQAEAFDFPDALFAPVTHHPPRPRPDRAALDRAARILRGARRPLLVLGGGVRYSGAAERALEFAKAHGLPVTETTAGRTLVPHDHPLHAGPLGITGSRSANALAAEADLVLAVGTRLQDFTTASWSLFSPDLTLVSVNTARFDAVKHGGFALVADADEALAELAGLTGGWRAEPDWTARAATERARWDTYVDGLRAPSPGLPTYAQVVGVVNDASEPGDYVLTASGGLPGELVGGWRATGGEPSMDVEYGFSCMGYELAGAWGAAMARPAGVVTALVGDGSYLMLNSELFSAAFAGHGFVAVVCDNGGYAVIDRLQRGNGAPAFNNLYTDVRSRLTDTPRVDLASHAASLGAAVLAATDLTDLRDAYARARAHARDGRVAVVVIHTHPSAWTDAEAWWEVGVPERSTYPDVVDAREDLDKARTDQVRYLGRP
ncbi:3D-(3,5/4)-trihydroxycyclohexane-1,2-dione acylhydrolase (decyclizing) [Actinophytocola xinjiangensis]|uniref:3D-(3,5/4)-trihydroxycyclohexane-1,2-dione acylhydrolase (Decyclizing) n=1 Tax=Actinophytocola xinjiangensis TaxID=485602 RepID=A0A7Z1AXR8_9PSEU|nr:3D-(3,5/4)-trihydroxycyclohexane-1,2-dione acylhydrolase (decyclizing) [Actinophytocola xinjiangensis]OLF09509.1 3D-(3,5/4)-trihydroxycyclohexane-1,2-dione acylhydrolase (decyclizing) [Actinophytocola xinjiangensis]